MKKFYLFLIVLLTMFGCEKHNKQPQSQFQTNMNLSAISTKTFVIQPENPTVNNTLTVLVPQNVTVKNITWYINTQQAMVGNSLRDDFKKGDNITAVVSYLNDRGKHEEIVTPAIVVKDSPPVITSITLEPQSPTIASTVYARVKTFDPDGDQVSLRYQWYVNGSPVNNDSGDSFSCSSYRHGDLISVVATPSDGEETGVSVASNSIYIQDSPPVIVSTPPTSITGSTFYYKVEATDLDNDPLSYRLESAPPGMTIDKDGNISWDVKNAPLSSAVPVKVVVDDGYGGKASQTFTLNIEKKMQ
ncbi:MAG: putative Ig domain-containing protein [bacterium]